MVAELMCLAVVALGVPAAPGAGPAVAGSAVGLLATGLVVEPPSADGKQIEKPARDRDAILGTWQVVKVEVDGEDVSETDSAKEFRSEPWKFTKNKIVLKEGVRELNYELDPFAKPKTLDMDNGGDKKIDCVYSLDGDTLKICGPVHPGGARPAGVESKKGSETRLLVLKRQTAGK